MSVKFKDLMNTLPAEKQAKVKAIADNMRMELQLYRIREELKLLNVTLKRWAAF